jgi:predicted N-acetyltransferase YhbS
VIEQLDTLPDGFWPALTDGEEDPFEVGEDQTRWRTKEDHLVLFEAGRAIAHVGLTRAEVEIGTERFEVVGVGGVLVNRDHRRQGRLRPLFEAALERASTYGPDRAMLFTLAKNAPVYERFGFARIAAPVVAGGQDMADEAMWKPLRDGVSWPDGPVNLPQLPF